MPSPAGHAARDGRWGLGIWSLPTPKVKGWRQGTWLTSLLPLQAPPLPPPLQPNPETQHYQVWSGQREGWRGLAMTGGRELASPPSPPLPHYGPVRSSLEVPCTAERPLESPRPSWGRSFLLRKRNLRPRICTGGNEARRGEGLHPGSRGRPGRVPGPAPQPLSAPTYPRVCPWISVLSFPASLSPLSLRLCH